MIQFLHWLLVSLSLFANLICFSSYRKYFFVMILFLPLLGEWLRLINIFPYDWQFQRSYVEIIFAFYFLVYLHKKPLRGPQLALFILPFLSLPSLLYMHLEQFYYNIFIFLFLVSGAGMYIYFQEKMEFILKSRTLKMKTLNLKFNQVDLTLLLATILGLIFRLYWAKKLNLAFINIRGAEMLYGSNYLFGIALLLFPFCHSVLIMTFVLFVFFFQFSRGIYLSFGVALLVWSILAKGYYRHIKKSLYFLVVIIILLIFLSSVIRGRLVERFRLQSGIPLTIESVIKHVSEIIDISERPEVARKSWSIAKKTNFLGVGFGGFYWQARELGFSNPHNLFLTAITEGGLLFFIGVCWLFIEMLYAAWRRSRSIFGSLIAFLVYGLYSGELYEASGWFLTGGYYYALIFLTAYLFREPNSLDQSSYRVKSQ